jgi:hypothetical protein
MSISSRYNQGHYTITRYEFEYGGDGDMVFCNFISDSKKGFKVPAKSLMIHNHAGGAGDNYLYYRTIHNELGYSDYAILGPDEFINYQQGEMRIWGIGLWASNANLVFSLDATPGEWEDKEVDAFITSPLIKKALSKLEEQSLTTELVIK